MTALPLQDYLVYAYWTSMLDTNYRVITIYGRVRGTYIGKPK